MTSSSITTILAVNLLVHTTQGASLATSLKTKMINRVTAAALSNKSQTCPKTIQTKKRKNIVPKKESKKINKKWIKRALMVQKWPYKVKRINLIPVVGKEKRADRINTLACMVQWVRKVSSDGVKCSKSKSIWAAWQRKRTKVILGGRSVPNPSGFT